MKRICSQCKTEMTAKCYVNINGSPFQEVRIRKQGDGIFDSSSVELKAVVCTNCGYVALYVDEFKNFDD